MTDFYHNKVISRARRHHQCEECFDGVQSGQPYQIHSGVFEGRFYSYNTCDRCSKAIQKSRDILKEGYIVGEFWSTILSDDLDTPFEIDASWNPPREWTHRLEVWLTPEIWMTRWNGEPGVSSSLRDSSQFIPHGWTTEELASKAVLKLDPDSSKYPEVSFRWVKLEGKIHDV